ncbi:ribbon-helix-helix domain-containing protein [Tessaracoccus caeni]|uniref:ribbon-helix-helix domain-containing protein n=1 Tax=Tessaracoccus caeni TaxID=3031239 RepID=UPI0023DB97B1|nr:CopG family transcriptional regulator [Tessaracoccus caeni]MDF1487886.1 ribbon-helix-helix domain-containing protein [Tessaracoccus caeni]
MRTTLTLEEDVARLVADATHRERRSTKDVINDALRRALSTQEVRPYSPPVFRADPVPGTDHGRLNQLVDELDDDALLEKLRP